MDISPHAAHEAYSAGGSPPAARAEIVDVAELLLLAALLRLGHETAQELPAEHANLRRTIRSLCDDARQQKLGAEQVIIILKSAWATICHREGRSMRVQNDELLQRVVSMCIEEFYAGP
ncbi:MAG: hypothetical protein ACR2OG_07070 [Gemmatimonadaceae bacterium]